MNGCLGKRSSHGIYLDIEMGGIDEWRDELMNVQLLK